MVLSNFSRNLIAVSSVIALVGIVAPFYYNLALSLAHQTKMKEKETTIRHFIESGGDINRIVDKDGITGLMHAALNGYETITRLLLEHGADIHARDNDGRTPLMCAAFSGNEQIVRLLLDSGADIHAKDNNRRTVLMYAVVKGNEAIVRLLIEEYKADIYAKDKSEYTAWLWAVYKGHISVANQLVKYGDAEKLFENVRTEVDVVNGTTVFVDLVVNFHQP
jgi:uncharacterized protein